MTELKSIGLVPETFILTTNGLRQIADLMPIQPEPFIAVCKANTSSADPFYKVADAKVFELRTANGYSIRGGASHPVLTQNGWTPLADVQKGHRVTLSYGDDIQWGSQDDFYEGESLGRIEATIDDEMLKRSSSFLKGYIAGLFAARGTAYTQNEASLRYVSSYNDLPKVQIALAAFGIHSNILKANDTTFLNITSEAIHRFADRIGLLDCPVKEKLDIYLANFQASLIKLQRTYTQVLETVPVAKSPVFSTSVHAMRAYSANGVIVGSD